MDGWGGLEGSGSLGMVCFSDCAVKTSTVTCLVRLQHVVLVGEPSVSEVGCVATDPGTLGREGLFHLRGHDAMALGKAD